MSKISDDAARAFNACREFKRSNTRVTVVGKEVRMFLHGNLIARHNPDGFFVSDGGYPLSVTTKSRLNALNACDVHTKAGVAYLNGNEWDGGEVDAFNFSN